MIGKTGRNWPIRDSKDQIKLITSSGEKPADCATPQAAQRSRENSTHVMRDPHATLHNFSPRSQEPAPTVSPYSGSRPRQRTFEEILGDEPHPDSPERQSPSKVVAPKIGAGKNFQPSRLFDKPDDAPPEPDSPLDVKSPPRYMKPHPTKYNHFEFVDGSDPNDAPQPGMAFESIKSKHRSQWDLGDFVTPEKAKPGKTIRHHNTSNWAFDDEDDSQPPVKPIALGRPRPDAGSQVGLQDDGSEPPALGNITNMKQRNKSYASQFDTTDEPSTPSPRPEKRVSPVPQKENNKPSLQQSAMDLRENGPNHRIRLGGDGMGNPKGGRGWSLGDDSD